LPDGPHQAARFTPHLVLTLLSGYNQTAGVISVLAGFITWA